MVELVNLEQYLRDWPSRHFPIEGPAGWDETVALLSVDGRQGRLQHRVSEETGGTGSLSLPV